MRVMCFFELMDCISWALAMGGSHIFINNLTFSYEYTIKKKARNKYYE